MFIARHATENHQPRRGGTLLNAPTRRSSGLDCASKQKLRGAAGGLCRRTRTSLFQLTVGSHVIFEYLGYGQSTFRIL